MITMPVERPAISAALPESTCVITTPWSALTPNWLAISGVRFSTWIPSFSSPIGRPLSEILREVKTLAGQGIREVTLLGQNVNSYGKKPGGEVGFVQLLEAVEPISGIERIRFTTSHPKDISPPLIACFAELPKLCAHIHLPAQAGSDAVLAGMNRGYTRTEYLEKITALKACQMRDTGQTLVKVETDAGLTGYGEAGGTGPMTRGFLKYYEEVLLGKDPLEVDRLYQMLMNYQHANRGHIPTTSGVDIALWDICGKFYGQPVCVLLGARWHERIRAYASTLFRPTPEAMRDAARAYLDEGFTAIKWGWGVFGRNPDHDVPFHTQVSERYVFPPSGEPPKSTT